MDHAVKGDHLEGESVGTNIYNGPGNNYDALGFIQKGGILIVQGSSINKQWI